MRANITPGENTVILYIYVHNAGLHKTPYLLHECLMLLTHTDATSSDLPVHSQHPGGCASLLRDFDSLTFICPFYSFFSFIYRNNQKKKPVVKVTEVQISGTSVVATVWWRPFCILTVPRSRLKYKVYHAFAVVAPGLWNSLPQNI